MEMSGKPVRSPRACRMRQFPVWQQDSDVKEHRPGPDPRRNWYCTNPKQIVKNELAAGSGSSRFATAGTAHNYNYTESTSFTRATSPRDVRTRVKGQGSADFAVVAILDS